MKKRSIVIAVGITIISVVAIWVLIKSFVSAQKIIKVEGNPEKGFNYEYFLYIPSGVKESETKYMLVEPNNTGTVDDDHSIHLKAAEKLVHKYPNRIADSLGVPLLIPSFDRPKSDWRMYTHALDSDTLKNNQGQLARIDLQLIGMINDARNRLREEGIIVKDKVLMDGFSASGNFANRFAALHPQIVQAVASGGVNCMPIIPCEEWEGIRLPFHVGIAGIDEMAGVRFDMEKYKKVAQYIYMGDMDDNDTLPYDDAFNENERQLVKQVIGEDMKGRWKKTKRIYEQLDIPAQMVMYQGVGHSITPEMEEDIIEFFKANMK